MKNKLMEAALLYRKEFDFSLIPANGKIARVEWVKFQEEKPSEDQIKEWWQKWPNSNIAIITGRINGITVLDIDWYKLTQEEKEQVNENFPQVATPFVISASGGEHRYFEYDAKIQTRNDVIKGVDIKNDGGMIIAPPSKSNGDLYKWDDRAKIGKMQFRSFPEKYLNSINILINHLYMHRGVRNGTSQNLTDLTKPNIYYQEGRRDDDMFHAANCLIKGGADPQFALQTLELIGNNLGKEFGPKVAKQKIDSAIKRIGRQDINISEEVREWINLTEGNFNLTQCLHELTLPNKSQKQAAYVAVNRLCKEGVIEKYGEKRGVYRRIEQSVYEDWMNSDYNPLEISLPFNLDDYVEIFPGDIIVIAGVKNSGKTALALDMIRLNKNKFDWYYHSSELVKQIFRLRISKCENTELDDWKDVKMSQGLSMVNAKDRTIPGALNIFDYIEGDEGEFYKIPSTMAKIHRALGNGIAIICLQKPTGRSFARGGEGTKDKASLYLTIDREYPNHIMKVEECKTFKDFGTNPQRFVIRYRIRNGINLYTDDFWQPEVDEKYKDFK